MHSAQPNPCSRQSAGVAAVGPRVRLRRGGFTLIELLVVIGIITILFGSVFAASRVLIARAKDRETQSLLTVVQQALDEFKREQTSNPTISRSKAYRGRYDRYPPDELEVFTSESAFSDSASKSTLAPGKAEIVPKGPYGAMRFYSVGLPTLDVAAEHRDLAAMIVAIETLGDASAAILDSIAERNRAPGPVDAQGKPVQFLDRNRNGQWDPTEDLAVRYIVDGWGTPLGYMAQRDFDVSDMKATESTNHPGWNGTSTEIIRMNGGQPLIFSYGANGKKQLTEEAMGDSGLASLSGDFLDGTHKIDNGLNADNVYINPQLAGKLSQGIVE